MIDLTLEACHEFWSKYQDPYVLKAIQSMEMVEKSCLQYDAKELNQQMSSLSEQIEKIGSFEPKDIPLVIKILSQLQISRVLRLLQAMDTSKPGSAAKSIMEAEKTSKDDPYAKLFMERNLVFEKIRILSRVFNNERIETIKEAFSD